MNVSKHSFLMTHFHKLSLWCVHNTYVLLCYMAAANNHHYYNYNYYYNNDNNHSVYNMLLCVCVYMCVCVCVCVCVCMCVYDCLSLIHYPRTVSTDLNFKGFDVVIVGFPYDIGCKRNGGRPGSRLGPEAFRLYGVCMCVCVCVYVCMYVCVCVYVCVYEVCV